MDCTLGAGDAASFVGFPWTSSPRRAGDDHWTVVARYGSKTAPSPRATADRRPPWLAQYPASVPAALRPRHANLLEALADQVRRRPEEPALRYFGRTLSWAELDAHARALAAGLAARGVAAGDRVALLLQNVPQFAIATFATWRLGAVVLPLNPMLRAPEVRYHLEDSGARALVALDSLYRDAGAAGAQG
ncbi:MAG: AMP-binding protein, partial [Candidatus Dormibacteraceae bacterium]